MIYIAFFDKSYVDTSFRTRLERQVRQNKELLDIITGKIKTFLAKIAAILFRAKRGLDKLKIRSKKNKELFDQNKWSASAISINRGVYSGNAQGEDLTVDGYISKHGGIESNIDGKVYTSKASYMDHIKANGCVIKDY